MKISHSLKFKTLAFISFTFLSISWVKSQSPEKDINHILPPAHTDRRTSLPIMDASLMSKWSKAIRQGEVIGNDFYSDQEIGMTPSQRFHANIDSWIPIDGYKRTMAGLVKEVYSNYEGYGNADINIVVRRPHILQAFQVLYQSALSKALESDPDAGKHDLELELDLRSSGGNEKLLTGANRIRTLARDGILLSDTVFVYGPLVSDRSHDWKPEIHPTEQIWWKRKNGNAHNFMLLFASDQSDRFDDERDFDISIIDPATFRPWAPRPMNGAYALAFTVVPGQQRAEFTINILADVNASKDYTDGKTHYLLYKNDTIAVVKEPLSADKIKVSFEDISIQTNEKANTVFGYAVLKSKVGIPKGSTIIDHDQGGYIFMKVLKNIKSVKPVLQSLPATQ